jgi:hypothetical protein
VALAFGLTLSGLGFGGAVFGRLGRRELRVEGDTICVRRLLGGRVWRSRLLARASVDDVTIGAGRGNRHECVRIVGAGQQLDFGRSLSDDERLLVRRWVAAGVVR